MSLSGRAFVVCLRLCLMLTIHHPPYVAQYDVFLLVQESWVMKSSNNSNEEKSLPAADCPATCAEKSPADEYLHQLFTE